MARNRAGKRPKGLAQLYEGVLTGIVRIRSGRQEITDSDGFRRRMDKALRDIGREGAQSGYDLRHVKDAEFALVGFLDEVVLTSDDPCRAQWVTKPFQEERFGSRDAGEEFFTRLEKIRQERDSLILADLLEIYLLCIQLGFEGRYSGQNTAELGIMAEDLLRRIQQIRGQADAISPAGTLSADGPLGHTKTWRPTRLSRTFGIAFGVVILLFLSFKLHLFSKSSVVQSVIHQAPIRLEESEL